MKARQAEINDQFVKECVSLEPLQISEEFVRLPGDLAYWNGRYADALGDHLRAKMGREKTEAQVRLRVREEAEGDAQGKRVTEGQVDALASSHPEYLAACEAEIEAEVAKARVAGVVDAVRAKKEMLMMLGSHLRHEQDPSIRKPEGRR